MLVTTLLEDRRERECAEYTADCLGALVQRIFRWSGASEFDFPLFSDAYAEKTEEKDPTLAEISSRLLSRLNE